MKQVRRESERTSWTRHDIDVLVPPGAALHLSGDARWKWMHGTRLGVAPGGGAAGGDAAGGGGGEGQARPSAEVNRLAGYGAEDEAEPGLAAPGTGAGAEAGLGAAAVAAAAAAVAPKGAWWFRRAVTQPAPAKPPVQAADRNALTPVAAPPPMSRGLLHWFGRPDELFGPTPERHSVVFAFAAPED